MTAARPSSARLLVLIGIAFHAVSLLSIFDIYFTSPVVRVDERFSATDGGLEAPADRLVLIVGDGLRADKLFQRYDDPPFAQMQPLPDLPPTLLLDKPSRVAMPVNATTPAPFLRSLITSGEASWGVSHTRVPTESRPGHVALLGGMPEDVSAVTRGWKHNPVPFDSILNVSSHGWGFGSPDIVPMFRDGATAGRVDMWCYDADEEDFSSSDPSNVDTWVLDRVLELFANATADATLDQQLRQPRSVFFLHLLALDTIGHASRPHGPEYYRAIAVNDAIVRRVVERFSSFFADDRTAFVYTADHGMSNIGNHGDGDPDNTRTPIVAWGAGIRRDNSAGEGAYQPDAERWGLASLFQNDLEQVDVAALMAALIGSDVPANSIGRLPGAWLDAPLQYRVSAAYANLRAALAQYQALERAKQHHAIRYRPYPGLNVTELVHTLDHFVEASRLQGFLARQHQWHDVALRGIRYLRTYDWLLLRTLVTLGYVGWVGVVALYGAGGVDLDASLTPVAAAAGATFVALAGKFGIERAPWTYYLYALSPCVFWSIVLPQRRLCAVPRRRWPAAIGLLGGLALQYVGYTERRAYTVLLIGLAARSWSRPASSRRPVRIAFSSACVATSIFTALPVEKGESIPIILLGAGAFVLLLTRLVNELSADEPSDFVAALFPDKAEPIAISMLRIETTLTSAAAYVASTSARSLQLKRGLPLWSQIAGWLILVSLPLFALRGVKASTLRIVLLTGALAPCFVLLSISYETLFLLAYSAMLVLWVQLEWSAPDATANAFRLRTASPTSPSPSRNAELAFTTLLYIHVGFFGTGNVASISSFYLEPVYRLLPVFSPFAMAALLILKILVPYAVLSAALAAMHRQLGLPTFTLYLLAIGLADVLTVAFFWSVRDQGSWLEIGQTISHFSIASLLICFAGALSMLGEMLMPTSTLIASNGVERKRD